MPCCPVGGDRGHRPHGPHRPAGARAAQHGHRGDAHPARFDPGGQHPAPGRSWAGSGPGSTGLGSAKRPGPAGPGAPGPRGDKTPLPGRRRWPWPCSVMAMLPIFGLKVGETGGIGLLQDRPGPGRLRQPDRRRRRPRRRAHAPGGAHDQARPARSWPQPAGHARDRQPWHSPRGRPAALRGHPTSSSSPHRDGEQRDAGARTGGGGSVAHVPGVLGVTGKGPSNRTTATPFSAISRSCSRSSPSSRSCSGPGVPLAVARRQGGGAQPFVAGRPLSAC